MSKNNDNFENDLELKLEPTNQGALFTSDYQSIKGKRLLIVGGSVLLFIIIAYLLTRSLSQGQHSAPGVDASGNVAAVTQHYDSVMVDFPEIVTNLAPTNDKESYIKLMLTLELNNTKDQDAVDKKLHMLKDTIIIFLRELRAADLTSAGGSMMLKTEVIKRVNKILYPVEIKDILFKEIFVNQ